MKSLRYILGRLMVLLWSSLPAQNQWTNNGNFKIHEGGRVSFYGDLINNGSLVDSGLVITLAGSTPQKIGGASIITFKNLTLNNPAGAYLASPENLTNELNITSGTFSTTGFVFTLLSNVYGTARIAPILGDFIGNITMERYLDGGFTSWRFMAAPVTGVTVNDWQDDFVTTGFTGATFPNYNFVSVYTYDETFTGISDFGYIPNTSAANPVIPGIGYWCYIGPVPLTVDVTGPPVKFMQTFTVSYTPSAGPSDDGYVMIGNPYPSDIDWNSNAWTKTNINGALYVWNNALQQYASWVAGVAINGGSNRISSSQSFWVQTNANSPALYCNENVKVSISQPLSQIQPSSVPNSVKLNFLGNNFKDETIIRFETGATLNYDSNLDARKFFSFNALVPGIASLDSNFHNLSINSLPLVNAYTHVPVKTIVGVSGIYTMQIDTASVIPADFCMVLEDLLTTIKTNVSPGNSYSFFIEDTTVVARFILHVSATSNTEVISPSCFNDQDGKAIAMALGTGPWNYTWLNTANVILQQSINVYGADTLSNIGAGVYLVQILDLNGFCGVFTKTIIVTEPVAIYANFKLSKDSMFAGDNDSLVIQNMSTGANLFTWNFGDGSIFENTNVPNAHHFVSTGIYSVALIAKWNICSDTMNKIVVVLREKPNSAVENGLPLSGISVYPNPGNGLVYLKLNNIQMAQLKLEIMNASGKKIYSGALLSELTEVDMRKYAKGIYFYHILSAGKSEFSGTLVIE